MLANHSLSLSQPQNRDDLDRIFKLEFQSFPEDESASLETILFRGQNASSYFYQAVIDNYDDIHTESYKSTFASQLVGFINGTCTNDDKIKADTMKSHEVNGHNLVIHSITVSPEFRRKGIGKALLTDYILRIVEYNHEIHNILLLCKGYLISFYTSCGFSVTNVSDVCHGQDQWFEMKLKLDTLRNVQLQIDAFTTQPYQGNPAAVVFTHNNNNETWMQLVAGENNLSETAFLRARSKEEPYAYDIRWFTPTREVDLCGHATLAAAYALFETYRVPKQKIHHKRNKNGNNNHNDGNSNDNSNSNLNNHSNNKSNGNSHHNSNNHDNANDNHDSNTSVVIRFHSRTSGVLTATRNILTGLIQLDFPATPVQIIRISSNDMNIHDNKTSNSISIKAAATFTNTATTTNTSTSIMPTSSGDSSNCIDIDTTRTINIHHEADRIMKVIEEALNVPIPPSLESPSPSRLPSESASVVLKSIILPTSLPVTTTIPISDTTATITGPTNNTNSSSSSSSTNNSSSNSRSTIIEEYGRSKYDILVRLSYSNFTQIGLGKNNNGSSGINFELLKFVSTHLDTTCRGIIVTSLGYKHVKNNNRDVNINTDINSHNNDSNHNNRKIIKDTNRMDISSTSHHTSVHSHSSHSQSEQTSPDPHLLKHPHELNVDFLSRCFFPNYGIDEDPVTGSAHCTLAPYWRDYFLNNKKQYYCHHDSKNKKSVNSMIQDDIVKNDKNNHDDDNDKVKRLKIDKARRKNDDDDDDDGVFLFVEGQELLGYQASKRGGCVTVRVVNHNSCKKDSQSSSSSGSNNDSNNSSSSYSSSSSSNSNNTTSSDSSNNSDSNDCSSSDRVLLSGDCVMTLKSQLLCF